MPVENDLVPRRWGTEQRIAFIEFKLFWDGSLNRSDIIDRFAISAAQASADLAYYREVCPDNMDYDGSQKRYFPTPVFNPRFLKPNAERYLAQLKALADGVISTDETWIEPTANFATLPVPARRVPPQILRYFLKAIRDRLSAHVEYQSLNDARPDPTWRWITPHALANDGLRWHIRAYCHEENRFKDFIISRFLGVGRYAAPGASAQEDAAWNSSFGVTLIPNPKLSAAQRQTIAMDYGMKEGRCTMQIRYALLYYFNKRLRLDIAEREDQPKETPVVIENRNEYDAALQSLN